VDDVWKLLTLLIACGVAYVAYQQYRLGRAKFKLDLFEKRFAVFDATRKLLGAMVSDGPGELEKVYEFRVAVADAPFLFCSDVTDYLDKVDNRAVDFWQVVKRMKTPSNDSHRDLLIASEADAQKWFKDQLLELKGKFGPYLDLRTWR